MKGDPTVDCDPVCETGPCFFLQAVAINDEAIAPTSCVHANPGDIIEAEIVVSGWGNALPDGAGIYQATIDARASSTSGLGGTILPLGWDAPYPTEFCSTNLDCPPGTVCEQPFCHGPNHDPFVGFFMDLERADFLFAGFPLVQEFVAVPGLDRYIAVAIIDPAFDSECLDTGTPTYGGTLRVQASGDACGTFNYQFTPNFSDTRFNVLDSLEVVELDVELHSLIIFMADSDCEVVCGDGQIESGEQCDDGNETSGDGCSANCQDEFVPIPTVSAWGLFTFTLMLLITAKLFRQAASRSI